MPLIFIALLFALMLPIPPVHAGDRFFDFQSIDVMKFSRDVAREKLNNFAYDTEIETQVNYVANTGATHIAIATPYDEEFVPFLRRWVSTARRHNLKIWFRGNFSGWEGWFGYKKITREEHLTKSREFILNHPELFEDGDKFSPCPECENGGPGDPRMNGDAQGHKTFLIQQYQIAKDAFKQIKKDVDPSYFSMNGDVARLIMDRETTAALGGHVTVDHYVRDVSQLVADVKAYAEQSGGKVVLGEFGAPIPDIHGDMSEVDQAQWIEDALKELSNVPELVGINYWVSRGGSTRLWNDDNSPRKAVASITKYFKPNVVYGTIKDEAGNSIDSVTIKTITHDFISENGAYLVPVIASNSSMQFIKKGYISVSQPITLDEGMASERIEKNITLIPEEQSIWYRFSKMLRDLLNSIRF